MSRVLVFNRYRLHSAACHRWLAPEHELFLLNCATRAVDADPDAAAIRSRYRQIAEFDDYLHDPAVLDTARDWIRRYGIDTILSFSEFDVLRAAQLRDEFGLAGQSVSSAEAFRDKLVMKHALADGGVPLVEFSDLAGPGSVRAAAARLGYPLLVKPRTGTGSRGIVRFDAPVDEATSARFETGEYLAERYTEHELLHCDGVFAEGRIVFGEVWSWSTTMLTALERSAPTTAITLPIDDPRRPAALVLAELTMRAMPIPAQTAFHIELFETAAGLVVNEAASRIGGGRIQPTLRRLHGVDLVELAARYQTNSAPETIEPRRVAPAGGFLIAYHNTDVTGFAPAECPIPGISDYESALPYRDGRTRAIASPSYLISGISIDQSFSRVNDNLLAMYAWFVRAVQAA